LTDTGAAAAWLGAEADNSAVAIATESREFLSGECSGNTKFLCTDLSRDESMKIRNWRRSGSSSVSNRILRTAAALQPENTQAGQ
jgi:hypothetical protein